MFVTSTGVVSRKYRGDDSGGLPEPGNPWYLLVLFTDPRTRRQKI